MRGRRGGGERTQCCRWGGVHALAQRCGACAAAAAAFPCMGSVLTPVLARRVCMWELGWGVVPLGRGTACDAALGGRHEGVQIRPDDAFGVRMVAQVAARGCPLLGLPAYPGLVDQMRRFRAAGWGSVEAVDAHTLFYRFVRTMGSSRFASVWSGTGGRREMRRPLLVSILTVTLSFSLCALTVLLSCCRPALPGSHRTGRCFVNLPGTYRQTVASTFSAASAWTTRANGTSSCATTRSCAARSTVNMRGRGHPRGGAARGVLRTEAGQATPSRMAALASGCPPL